MTGGTGTAPGQATAHHRPGQGPGAGTAFHRQSVLELAPLYTAIPCFRLHTAAVLREWGLPRDLIRDAELLVSELMTNACDASAVLPERPPITLRLLGSERSVVIEAWDHSTADPEPRRAGDDDECWRGLAVVAAYSTRWGFERTGYRQKVVRAEIALPDSPR